MGYFSNGTEGEMYQEDYCSRCVHDKDNSCPIWNAHLMFNYQECNKPDSILHMLIPRENNGLTNGACLMFIDAALSGERDEPIGYVADVELAHLKMGASCVDLLKAPPVDGFSATALYEKSAFTSSVESLKWCRDNNCHYSYTPFGGSYVITEYKGMSEPFQLGQRGFGGSLSRQYATLEAAKADAQADYEQRIRSALVPSPFTKTTKGDE